MHESYAPVISDTGGDVELMAIMDRAARAIERMGLTAQDFLDELPTAQAEVLEDVYGRAHMEAIERRIAAYRQQSHPDHTSQQG